MWRKDHNAGNSNFPLEKVLSRSTSIWNRYSRILLPELIPGVTDEPAAIRAAVSRPIGSRRLQELANGKSSIAIVINDITRPSPTEAMLTVLVETLAEANIPPANITVLVATAIMCLPPKTN